MPPYHYRCAGYCNIPPLPMRQRGSAIDLKWYSLNLNKHALAVGTHSRTNTVPMGLLIPYHTLGRLANHKVAAAPRIPTFAAAYLVVLARLGVPLAWATPDATLARSPFSWLGLGLE